MKDLGILNGVVYSNQTELRVVPRLSCRCKGAGNIHLLAVSVQEGELLRVAILARYAWHHVPPTGP